MDPVLPKSPFEGGRGMMSICIAHPDASGLSEVGDFTPLAGHESGDSRQKRVYESRKLAAVVSDKSCPSPNPANPDSDK